MQPLETAKAFASDQLPQYTAMCAAILRVFADRAAAIEFTQLPINATGKHTRIRGWQCRLFALNLPHIGSAKAATGPCSREAGDSAAKTTEVRELTDMGSSQRLFMRFALTGSITTVSYWEPIHSLLTCEETRST